MTQAENYTIIVTPHPAGIRIEVEGAATYANTVAYWLEIIAEVKVRRPKTLLLIDKMRGEPLSAKQWHSLVEAMQGQGLESTLIAHVKPYGLQLVEHCEIYAREAGLHARVFDDESRADLWLRYGEKLGNS
jgi:hypothetical protein